MIRPRHFAVAFVAAVVIVAACAARVTPAEISGQWKLREKADTEVLQLNGDSTFTHEWISDGRRRIAVGEWELTDAGRAPRVLLRYRRDFEGHSSGASLNVVRQWSGGLGLSADPDRQSVFSRT